MANISINLDSLSPKKFKKTVRHKIKDGVNTLRFLPPFGEESSGYPYRKWNVVWGLIDPNSGRMRPYASSSTYENQCPVYDYLDLLKAKVEKEKAEFTASGATEDQVKAKFKPINDFISAIRPKTVYAYNATDKSGTVGVVELKSTAHKDVINVMSQYIKDYNQDPTSLNSDVSDSGVWINVKREGQGFDTKYSAAKNQIMVKDANGVPQYQDDRSPIAENIVHSYDDLAYDLNTIYEKKTYDELKEILVANILNTAQDIPEILVPGFGLEEFSAPVQNATSVETVQVPSTPANNVSLKLDEPEAAAQSAQPASNGADTEDLLAMADDLFNS
jgi:hypothetical protein